MNIKRNKSGNEDESRKKMSWRHITVKVNGMLIVSGVQISNQSRF